MVNEDVQSFRIGGNDAGARLDAFLARRLELSRIQVRRLLRSGRVRLGGRDVSLRAKGAALSTGDEVEVHDFIHPDGALPAAEPEVPLAVLKRGADWIAVEKPAGVPVHPLDPDQRGTLLNALIARHPEMAGVGEGSLRSGVVHRLDVDTSGVMLFATAEARWRALRRAFEKGNVEKVYRAVVRGTAPERGACDLWLRVSQHRPARVRVVEEDSPGGRRTRMRFECTRHGEGVSHLRVFLETGFLHQIRVSLAHLGFPVIGDDRYGETPEQEGERLMLHAERVATGEIDVASSMPPGFA